ncbi:BTAD domain-containing putative transcriptional regulator [Streptomyces sp. NPDC048595]|uniref:AfsR/SARP family transcriptional regulator n=1 Tax=Streptomyces sp. NPDC048595 TaxID=3365576 RepID=UPI00371D1854
MQFAILGSLTVRLANGDPLENMRPRQRSALCILLLNSERRVSKRYLADALWGTDLPSDPGGALRSNFYGLRKATPIKGRLQTGRDGYGLALHEGDVLDLHRFQSLAQQARAAQLLGDVDAAARLCQRALDTWGDPPLADIPATPLMQPVISELLEHRHAVQESLVDARLALGQHHELLPFLMSLTTAQPLRERRWEQLILALYRCGRRAEALDTFTRARRLLAEDYGIDPGGSLQHLHQLILAGGPMPSLAPPVPPQRVHADAAREPRPQCHEVPRPPVGVPHQLPAEPRHFIGRAAELRVLTDVANEMSPVDSSPVVSVVCGPPGIGKTAFALHFAHKIADRFPDGQLHIDLGAFSPATDSVSVQQAIRSVLAPLISLPEPHTMTPAAYANLYRTTLAQRQMLVLIDNAYDSAQVQPLIPATPQCMVVITSRRKLTGLVTSHGAHLTTLDVPSRAEAEALLASRLAAGGLDLDGAALAEVTEACARLPLALVIAATRAVARPMVPPRHLAEELQSEQNRLNVLCGGRASGDIRAAFSWSYQRLTGAEARMFRVLGAHRIRDITAADAGRLADVPALAAMQALTGLAHAHLVREYAPKRYRFDDLVSTYAAEKAREEEDRPPDSTTP